MRAFTETTSPADFVGSYGPRWRAGVISDHLESFVRAGGVHRPSRGTSAGWAVVDGRAYPALCSEVVRIETEDGPISGRCGNLANGATGACDAHEGDDLL